MFVFGLFWTLPITTAMDLFEKNKAHNLQQDISIKQEGEGLK